MSRPTPGFGGWVCWSAGSAGSAPAAPGASSGSSSSPSSSTSPVGLRNHGHAELDDALTPSTGGYVVVAIDVTEREELAADRERCSRSRRRSPSRS